MGESKIVISKYNIGTKKGFNELDIVADLLERKEQMAPEEQQNIELDILAFRLGEYFGEQSLWGTHYGPWLLGHNEDGEAIGHPPIETITPEMIKCWEERIKICENPIFKAKYTDLVWDLKEIICGEKPSHTICRSYIESIIEIASKDFYKYPGLLIPKLKRALLLACGLNASELINQCKDTILKYEARIAKDDKPGLWGFSYDLLFSNQRVHLSEEEKRDIIDELNNRVERLKQSEKPNPWAVEAAVTRLADYYRKQNSPLDVKRVLWSVVEMYEKIMPESAPLQQHGWYTRLIKRFRTFNMNEEADKLLLRLQKIEPGLSASLGTISQTFEIPKEEVEQMISRVIVTKKEEIIPRLIHAFIPTKEVAIKFLEEYKDSFIAEIPQNIHDDKGRLIAAIGPLKEDLAGHIVLHLSMRLKLDALYLKVILDRVTKENILSLHDYYTYITQSIVLDERRYPFIGLALEAYFRNDYITFCHLAIPQIENMLRTLLEKLGGNSYKPARNGGFNLKILDDILRERLVISALGEDVTNYFQIVLTDQRGWNLRNEIFHGLVNPEQIGEMEGQRVLHLLLCLGSIRARE